MCAARVAPYGEGTNSGSLKTYYFAHLHGLDEASALNLFCEHYKVGLDATLHSRYVTLLNKHVDDSTVQCNCHVIL